jgi:hypothetical protein
MSSSKTPILVGIGLVAAGIAVYALDSWRGSHRGGQIDYVLKNARQITTIDVPPLSDGELVIATDVPMPGARIADPDLGFSVEALAYSRSVEILQWREYEDTSSGQPSYSYRKEWVGAPISSTFFESTRHRNRGDLPFRDRTIRADEVTFGDLKLDKAFFSSFPSASRLNVSRDMYDEMPNYFRQRFAIVDGGLFPNRDPEIGDIRVRFTAVQPRQSTVVGAYSNGSIVPAKTEAGEIAILREGNLSLEELGDAEKSSNKSIGIFLKIVAAMLAIGGVVLAGVGIRQSGAGGTLSARA